KPALSPLRCGALRSAWKYPLCGGEGCQATTFLNRSRLFPAPCRAPQRGGASRGSRFVCPIDRPVPNTEADKARIQHEATGALEGHFFWVTFLLGQQKKSDSAAGRPSKRPLRKRPGRRHARDRRPRAKSLDSRFRGNDGEG